MTLENILADFQLLDDWEDRYRYVIELGRALPPLPEAARTEANRVRGCASQVWLATEVNGATDGAAPRLIFKGDSDAHVVRGIAEDLAVTSPWSSMPTGEKLAESAQPAPAGKPSALPEAEITRLNDEIVTALKTVYDPEIPADIYEIGLIYRIDIADDRTVKVDMSLTSPNCPSAQLPVMVLNAISTVPGVGKVDVSVVRDPPWDPSRMSDERVVLNMF